MSLTRSVSLRDRIKSAIGDNSRKPHQCLFCPGGRGYKLFELVLAEVRENNTRVSWRMLWRVINEVAPPGLAATLRSVDTAQRGHLVRKHMLEHDRERMALLNRKLR